MLHLEEDRPSRRGNTDLRKIVSVVTSERCEIMEMKVDSSKKLYCEEMGVGSEGKRWWHVIIEYNGAVLP